jgi:hypothetical protein
MVALEEPRQGYTACRVLCRDCLGEPGGDGAANKHEPPPQKFRGTISFNSQQLDDPNDGGVKSLR